MEKNITIAFRNPIFPVLLNDNKKLEVYLNINELCLRLAEYNQLNDKLKIIDSTAEEFWFIIKDKTYILAPGFTFKKWTKKQIIELYNQSNIGKRKPYDKNLSNIKLNDLIKYLCKLIQED